MEPSSRTRPPVITATRPRGRLDPIMLILASRRLWPGAIPTAHAGPSAPYSRYSTLKGEPGTTCLRGHRSPLATASQKAVGSLLATRQARPSSRSAGGAGARLDRRVGVRLGRTVAGAALGAGSPAGGAGGGDGGGGTGGPDGAGGGALDRCRQARHPSRSRPATTCSAAPQCGQQGSM